MQSPLIDDEIKVEPIQEGAAYRTHSLNNGAVVIDSMNENKALEAK